MLRKIGRISLLILLILLITFLLGPRVEIDTTIRPLTLPDDLDSYLAQSEAQFDDLVPNTEKTIIWANESREKTPFSVIYLHGFSSTRQESAPLSDQLAAELGANLFYTRYTGHGRTGEALAKATVNDWLNDTHEAFEIGKQIGEQVIVIGLSTGGAAATWLLAQPDIEEAAAFILISPNYRPRDASAEILTMPWGEQIANLVAGEERSWEIHNPEHGIYWTNRYPTAAVLPMMGLVKLARTSDIETAQTPVLVIYSPNDQVISVPHIESVYERFTAPQKALRTIDQVDDPSNHVLAGDILSPSNTDEVNALISAFLADILE